MAAVDTDLLLVQRGNQPYRETVENISTKIRSDLDVTLGGDIPIASAAQLGVIRVGTNLEIDGNGILSAVIPAGLQYMGTWDQVGTVPADSENGHFYIWDGADGAILANALWGAANGSTVNNGDRLFFDGTDWEIITAGGGGLTQVTGTAPIQVSAVTDGEQDISIDAASGTSDGSMSSEHWTKLEGIEAGAEVNVDPTQTYTPAADKGTLTLTPGGDTTDLPVATETAAGLMSAADKATLDGLVATPGGVTSLTARNGITNNGTAGAPILDIDFGALPNGDAATAQVMPYDISALNTLP